MLKVREGRYGLQPVHKPSKIISTGAQRSGEICGFFSVLTHPALDLRETSVDEELGAGYVTAVVRRQEHSGFRNLVGKSQPR
jgi:hypothetical protein